MTSMHTASAATAAARDMSRNCTAHSLLRHLVPLQLRGTGAVSSQLRHAFRQQDGLLAVALRAVAVAPLPLSPRVLFAEALQCLVDGTHTQRDVRERFDAAALTCRRLLALDDGDDSSAATGAAAATAAAAAMMTRTRTAQQVLLLLQPRDVAALQWQRAYADESEWCGQHSRSRSSSSKDSVDDADDDNNDEFDEQLQLLAVQHHPHTRLLTHELCMACSYYAALLSVDNALASAAMTLRVTLTSDIVKDVLLAHHMLAFAKQPRHVVTGARVADEDAAAASLASLPRLLQQQQQQQQQQHNEDNAHLSAATERVVGECLLLERDAFGRRRFDVRASRERCLLHDITLDSLGKTPQSFALLYDDVVRRYGRFVIHTTPVYDGRWLRHSVSCGDDDHRVAPSLLPPSTLVVSTHAQQQQQGQDVDNNNTAEEEEDEDADDVCEQVRFLVRYDQPLCTWDVGQSSDVHVLSGAAAAVCAAAAAPQQRRSLSTPYVYTTEFALPDTTRSWLTRFFVDR